MQAGALSCHLSMHPQPTSRPLRGRPSFFERSYLFLGRHRRPMPLRFPTSLGSSSRAGPGYLNSMQWPPQRTIGHPNRDPLIRGLLSRSVGWEKRFTIKDQHIGMCSLLSAIKIDCTLEIYMYWTTPTVLLHALHVDPLCLWRAIYLPVFAS